MRRRQILEAAALFWAVVGAAVAIAGLPGVNDDARVAVGAASVAFPLCAVGAAMLLRRGREHAAGLLLVASAATPTYFAFALNVPALLIGAVLLVAPGILLQGEPEPI